ncbi:sugar ABC transporter substrate-binding protein [Devosia pacifica]|uniref:Sugar ABC transporter substrate-binding protein n=1 Tax=Devosia pacifica TaxID=1335967 RepID=A0A918S3F2_9HYPH|nr:iron ABC transporter permease [Devosia pacifica]GHA18819.1 sugar ABC transporter substrate-binding protein [Devosia pacifica]
MTVSARSASARLALQLQRIPLTMGLPLLAAVLLLSVTLAVTIGPVDLSMMTAWRIVLAKITGTTGDWSMAAENIVWMLRLPRVLLAAAVGGGLAIVGVAMQAVVRNPLADPYVLGISSGASVGAVLVLGLGWFGVFGIYAISAGAFLGAVGAFALVFLIAIAGGQLSPLRLVLAGVACGYSLSGVTSLIVLTSDDRELARSAMEWLLGSFGNTAWADLGLPLLVLLGGGMFLLSQSRALNALLIGDDSARTLGVDVGRLRIMLFIVLSLLTGVMVAVSGAIGFVGLVVPHIVRMIVGTDHRRVLPVSMLLGATFLVWVDVGARMLFAPAELPVGVITSILGGPFFVWMLATNRWKPRET